MNTVYAMISIIVVGVLAGMFVKWCLYDGWYQNRNGSCAKQNLIVGCIAAVICLVAAVELVVGIANFKKTYFYTSRDVQLEMVEFDNRTETIRWAEPGGEEQQASLYSVELVFGAERPELHELVRERRTKMALYVFGLKEIYDDPLYSVERTFSLPNEIQDAAKNGFKKP